MTGKDAKTMYVLLANSTIMKTADSGSTWVDVTPPPAVNGGRSISQLSKPVKRLTNFGLAYGNAQNTVKVLSSTDGGSSWTNITTPELTCGGSERHCISARHKRRRLHYDYHQRRH